MKIGQRVKVNYQGNSQTGVLVSVGELSSAVAIKSEIFISNKDIAEVDSPVTETIPDILQPREVLILAEAYTKFFRISLSALGRRLGDVRKFSGIAKGSATINTLQQVHKYLHFNWPHGLEWPQHIIRYK